MTPPACTCGDAASWHLGDDRICVRSNLRTENATRKRPCDCEGYAAPNPNRPWKSAPGSKLDRARELHDPGRR